MNTIAVKNTIKISQLLLASILTLIFIHPITNFDIWWHLDSGYWMWQHQSIIDREVRSLTAPDANWTNVHWTFQLLLSGFHQLLSDWGLLLLKALLVFCLFLIVTITNYTKKFHFFAFFSSLLLLGDYLVGHLLLRPHLLSYIYFACLIFLFSKPFQRYHLWLFLGLLLLWANSHLSAIVGTTAVIIHLLFNPNVVFNSFKQRIIISLSFAILPLCTPFTIDIVPALFSHGSGQTLHYIQEWYASDIFPPMLFGLIILAFVGASLRYQKINPGELFLLVFFIWQSAKHARFEGELALLLIRPTSQMFDLFYNKLKSDLQQLVVPFFVVLATATLTFYDAPILWLKSNYRSFPVEYNKYPIATVAVLKSFAQTKEKPLKVFNSYGLGGFIAFNLKEHAKIFIDGRTPLVFNRETMLEDRIAEQNTIALLKLTEYYQFDALLLRAKPQLRFTIKHPDWQLVAYDHASLLYIRRDLAKNSQLPNITYNPQRSPIPYSEFRLQQTKKLLQYQPKNPLALLHFALLQQDPKQQLQYLQKSYALNPSFELTNILLAERLIHYQPNFAVKLLDSLLATSSAASSPREITIARLYLQAGYPKEAHRLLYPDNYSRLADLETTNFDLWIMRGYTACQLKQQLVAEEALNMAFLLAVPDNVEHNKQLVQLQNIIHKAPDTCSKN